MKEVPISEFKAKCLALLEQVRKTKTPLRVTRFGRPIAEVVPISQKATDWLGSLADVMKIFGDVISPVIDGATWRRFAIEATVSLVARRWH